MLGLLSICALMCFSISVECFVSFYGCDVVNYFVLSLYLISTVVKLIKVFRAKMVQDLEEAGEGK